MHVTMVPNTNIESVKAEIQAILDDLAAKDRGIQEQHRDLSRPQRRRGIARAPTGQGDGCAHRAVSGKENIWPEPYRYSVSSDGSTLDDYGVPAITYGPGGITGSASTASSITSWGEILSLTNLVDCTRAYALAAADLCNRDRAQWLKDTQRFQRFQG